MRKLDLKPSLGGRGALAEDFEDEAGAVDDLGLGDVLDILLLDRGQRRVDDQQMGIDLGGERLDLVELALSEQAGRARGANAEALAPDNVDADRSGQPGSLVEPRVERAHRLDVNAVGQHHQRAFAARHALVIGTVEDAQLPSPAPPRRSSSSSS